MAEIKQVFVSSSLPGIKRDGTTLDGDNYSDGQWVRFQRGRPKKMGGYQQIVDRLYGPVRQTLVWSRVALNAVVHFSPYGIQQVLVDNNGLGSALSDRTPAAGFTASSNIIWSTSTQYDDAVATQGTIILAHASLSMLNIDDDTTFKPYWAVATTNTQFAAITDAPAVSGGVFAVAPYTFVHGSDGFIAWSGANQPQVWYTSSGNIGDAGADRVTGSKIVKGLPLRSGSGPAALLWSLDSVLRMDYVGGSAIFRFTHLSTQSSVLAQNSVIEYDGVYFWLGVDRFLTCNGSEVAELPNTMNLNWFFDNLNYDQRQKVWAMKVPRYGEVWWFFPFGDATECTHAVIFNVREKTWYDIELARSSGFYSQVLHYPVMTSSYPTTTNKLTLTITVSAGTISVGDVLRGVTSGITASVIDKISSTLYVVQCATDDTSFVATEGITDLTSGASGTLTTIAYMYQSFIHEKGTDAIVGETVSAIPSHYTTADFGLPTGGAQQNQPQGVNRWTRLVRVEPDFIQTGEMSMEVLAREFANAPEQASSGYNFTAATERIDVRQQARQIQLRFTSNTVGGHYEAGRIIIHTEPGDIRS